MNAAHATLVNQIIGSAAILAVAAFWITVMWLIGSHANPSKENA